MQVEQIDPNKEYWEKAVPWSFTEEKISYEKKRLMRYELQDYMFKAIPFSRFKRQRVLELGCGSGIDALEFARNGAYVTALDFTEKAILQSEENKRQCEMRYPINCDFKKQDLTKLDLPSKNYDLIYCFGVLHHIKDPEPIIEKCYNALRYDGQIIAMLYNKDSLLYSYSIEHLGLSTERITGCPFTKAYTYRDAVILFSQYFKQIEIKVFYNVIDLPQERKVRFETITDLRTDLLGWHLIVYATKS